MCGEASVAASARSACRSPGLRKASGCASSAPAGRAASNQRASAALRSVSGSGRRSRPSSAQRVVEDEVARICSHELRVRRFAVEALLQVVEARDFVAGFNDQLAVEHRLEVHAREHLGKRARNLVARAREQPLAGGRRDHLHADAVILPFGHEFGGRDRFHLRFLDGVREHDGMERHRILAVRFWPPAFEPSEQVEIGRLLRVPNLLDFAHAHAAVPRQHVLHRARRHADTQRLHAELEQRPALRRCHVIEQQRQVFADRLAYRASGTRG